MKSWIGTVVALMAAGWASTLSLHAAAQSPAPAGGAATYQARCAACHDHSDQSRAPARDVLAQMRPASIDYALTDGKMKVMGAGLSPADRAALIAYLTGGQAAAVADWTQGMTCPAERRRVDLSGPAPVTTFGFDLHNTRTLTARQAGLTRADLSNLELAWSIAIPHGTAMRSQPAIVGKTVFLPVAEASALYAFDVSEPLKPCIKWVFRAAAPIPLRTSAAYGVLADGRGVLAFAGADTTLYLVDAKTGSLIWSRKVGTFSRSLNTGTPVVLKDRIIVPVSQYEISVAGQNSALCCNNHGYVLSLSPRDGAQQWRYDTMEDARPIRDRGDGKMLYGPSGAPIWNSPAIDETRRLIYFGTGESNSPPVSKNTDAIIAIGLDDGKARWSHQATARDIYVEGCGPTPKPTQLNCVSDTVFRDVDFGASMILGQARAGQAAVFAGQKSGAVYAMDPASGAVIWRQPLGTGSPLGGVHWGIAYDGRSVYAPISLVGEALADEAVDPATIKSGLYALDPATGAVKWVFATEPDCAGERRTRVPSCARMYGFSTAPAIIDGAVVEGGLDGYLYVLDARDGRQLWKYDTAVPMQGLNGVPGKGGSIDAASITAADGLLFVNSGYGVFGETAGNLILAFRARR